MKQKNIDIRNAMQENSVFQYEVAEIMHISEAQFSKMLRKELSAKEKQIVYDAIRTVALANIEEG